MRDCEVQICLMNRETQNRPSCYRNQSMQLKRALEKNTSLKIKTAMCFGLCDKGPIVKVTANDNERTLTKADQKLVEQTVGELCQA